MKKKANTQKDKLKLLKDEAEKILSSTRTKEAFDFANAKKAHELLHEIEVFKVELEMQNDELRVSHEALEKEKLKFVGFFNLAPVGYFILTKLLMVEECNETGAHFLNGKRGEIISSRFSTYISVEDSEIFYQFIRKTLDSKTRQTCELKMISRKRNIFYGQLEGVMVDDPFLEKQSIYVAVVDITEKKIAEFKQRETNEQLTMALVASSTGTWNVNPKSQLIKLDNASAEMFGYTAQSFHTSYDSLLKLVHKEDVDKVDKALRLAIQSNTDLNLEFKIVLPDGTLRHLEARGHTTEHYSEDPYFAGIFTDITLKKQLTLEVELEKEKRQKEILRAIVETQEKERMRISHTIQDSIGQLLYAVNLNLLKTNHTDEFITKAKNLVDQTIGEARKISFELAPSILADYGLEVALKEMIKRVQVPELQFTLKLSGFGIRLQLTSEVFVFRIIQELVNNVIKHSKATHGTIEVKRKKNTVLLGVGDNGKGFKLADITKGSGLMSIKNRLSLYNGTLSVKYSKKSGNCVSIKLYDIQ